MTERCTECGQVDGHADRCPNRRKPTFTYCPECGAQVGMPHAERCPVLQPPKPADDRTLLEKTVEEWASSLADSIPKPKIVGWKTKLPMETENRQHIVTPDGRSIGMRSRIATEKSGPEQLWELKRKREPCWSCRHFSRDLFEDKDRAELALFLQREAKWDTQAIKLILSDLTAYGVCTAHSEGGDRLHVTHRDASCLRLYQPRKKGWLQSLGGMLFGGSRRHDF